MVEAYFYGRAIFVQWKCISTEKADFYCRGVFLRHRFISMEIAYNSTEKAYFCEKVNLKAIGLLLV